MKTDLFSALNSVMSYWYLKIVHDRSVYNTQTANAKTRGFVFLFLRANCYTFTGTLLGKSVKKVDKLESLMSFTTHYITHSIFSFPFIDSTSLRTSHCPMLAWCENTVINKTFALF